MKIGIELRAVTFGASGGISQYLQGTLQAAFRLHPEHQFIAFCTLFSRPLMENTPSNVKVETVPGFRFFTRIDEAFSAGEMDVLFRSYPMEAALQMPWNRQVFLIPDLQHEVYPEFYTPEILRLRRLAFNQALSRAGALVAFTEYVRGTILDYQWTRCRDVFLSAPALTLGHDRAGELAAAEQALIPSEEFFLYPANLWPHKNHRRILQAFQQTIARLGRKARLTLTGHPDGWDKLRDEFGGLPVTHLGFVREQLMQALMARARAVPFFSLHEGFGIPLLEAFQAGTPVICSNTTSLPEVGGDAVLSCDPTDVGAISGLMERMLVDEPMRQELIERGKKRLSRYTWDSAAHGVMEACEHAAKLHEPASIEVSQRPLVTVVTPSYNQGRFLKATIESVLTQSYQPIQYIVMDGGSKDESVEILKSYGDRFHWESKKDKGQADAINQGMALAQGQVLAYLNSDDVFLPGAVERAVAHFQSQPDCDMLYGNARYIDAAGNTTGMYNTAEYSFPRLMTDCCVCQPAAFWRERIARKIGPFDENRHCALDYDYWLRIDRAGGRIQFIPDLLACSRLYPDTKTMSLRRKFYKEIFDVCLKNGGYVDYNYFLGLWHHRVKESDEGWPRWLKPIPGSFVPLAWIHHKAFGYAHNGPKYVAAQLFNGAMARAGRLPKAGRYLSHGLQTLKSYAAPSRVEGFFGDNWMQPDSRILVRPKATGQKLRHIGMAPVDMKVTVQVDRKILGSYPLYGGRIQAIGEDIALDGDQPVTLRFHFSDHTIDAARRKLSFLVTETNLFGENDLA